MSVIGGIATHLSQRGNETTIEDDACIVKVKNQRLCVIQTKYGKVHVDGHHWGYEKDVTDPEILDWVDNIVFNAHCAIFGCG